MKGQNFNSVRPDRNASSVFAAILSVFDGFNGHRPERVSLRDKSNLAVLHRLAAAEGFSSPSQADVVVKDASNYSQVNLRGETRQRESCINSTNSSRQSGF